MVMLGAGIVIVIYGLVEERKQSESETRIDRGTVIDRHVDGDDGETYVVEVVLLDELGTVSSRRGSSEIYDRVVLDEPAWVFWREYDRVILDAALEEELLDSRAGDGTTASVFYVIGAVWALGSLVTLFGKRPPRNATRRRRG